MYKSRWVSQKFFDWSFVYLCISLFLPFDWFFRVLSSIGSFKLLLLWFIRSLEKLKNLFRSESLVTQGPLQTRDNPETSVNNLVAWENQVKRKIPEKPQKFGTIHRCKRTWVSSDPNIWDRFRVPGKSPMTWWPGKIQKLKNPWKAQWLVGLWENPRYLKKPKDLGPYIDIRELGGFSKT